ncbi:MAG: indole-3-glycerol phosphate synthase TrpC [Chitinophagales bacterium]
MNILEQIIEYKKIEVAEHKKNTPVSALRDFDFFETECESLKESLLYKDGTGIIAEFKRRSPSKGIINDAVEIFGVLDAYDMKGASGISILTDEKYFGGTLDDIYDHRAGLFTPVLRKDFIIDEYQILESKAIGADVILLIAACLPPAEVKRLAGFAKNLGLEVLLELHDEKELEHICDETELVGINNRNLKTFEVNIEHSLRMAEKTPKNKIKIAESGIHSVEDVVLFRENGFKGFLIGELFMKEADPGIAFAKFIYDLPKA